MVPSMYEGLEWYAAVASALAPLIAVISAFALPLLTTIIREKKALFAFIYSEIIFIINAFLTTLVFYYEHVYHKIFVYIFAGFPAPYGIIYEVDYFNSFFGLLIGLVFPLLNIASYHYLERSSKHNEWYYTLYLGLQAGLLGIVYTGDLFNLFVMLEVMSITAYGLTAYLRERGRPLNAAIKYGLFGAVASTIYFLAVIFLYSSIGTLAMPDAAATAMGLPFFSQTYGLAYNPYPALILFAGLAVWAFMIESAIFPHHFWLPDAYSSMPAIAAGTMAAVAEGVGVYVIMRIVYTIVGASLLEWLLVLLIILGSVNVVVGGYLMCTTHDAKTVIAYSTILDMGYVIIGVGLGSVLGLKSALYYILAHAMVKPLLFTAIGEVEAAHGTTDMDKLIGMGGVDPYISSSLIIGGLAVIGVPPLNIFFAKLLLFEAVFNSSAYPLLIIILLGSAFAFVGFARLWYSVIGIRRRGGYGKIARASESAKFILVVLMIGVVLTGIFYNYLDNNLITGLVNTLLHDRHEYVVEAYNLLKTLLGG
jgi:multicomponent Na+:H+ antiporter subunit D